MLDVADPRVFPPAVIAALVVALAVGAVAVGLLVARWWRGVLSRARNRVAQRGERTAESILRSLGYEVIARQATRAGHVMVDGVEVAFEVRADLLVRRRGRTLVAEVKSGNYAPDPCHPPTRRQLLEYALLFGAREVLLVDVAERAVRSVSFPNLENAAVLYQRPP